jgi:hypothetical protein
VIDMLGLMGDAVDNIPVFLEWVKKRPRNYWKNMIHSKEY